MGKDKVNYRSYYTNWEAENEIRRKKDKRREIWIFSVRIILFPIMLIVRLFRWTYHYD